MSPAETRTWGWALAASLAIHGALVWQVRAVGSDGGHGTPAPVVTRVRFQSTGSAPSAMNTIHEPAKPKPEQRPPPEKAKQATAMPERPPKPTPAEAPAMAAVQTGSVTSAAATGGSASPAQLRQRYQGELLAHIERRKFYPEVARRRGVTGGVRVEFIVGPGGSLSGLGCSAGAAILNEAACEAVRRSVPLPEPPADLQFPIAVSFVMEFALK